MTIKLLFQYESVDSTEYLNNRLKTLVSRGIYYGGLLTPVSGTLSCRRSPFFAMGYDGSTVYDADYGIGTYTADQINYHCILAKYNVLGYPSSPVLQEKVLSYSDYLVDPDKNYLIVVAAVVVPPGATEILNTYISYFVRDTIDPLGRTFFRGVVSVTGSLPEPTPSHNRVGDFYMVSGSKSIYLWTGTAWEQIVAVGAATLDGAYDDGGVGMGRTINADAGAVEIIQNTTAQRENDIGNSVVRINKSSSSTIGDVGIDIKLAQDKDVGSILIRSLYTSGTDVQEDEPVNLAVPNAITCTRVAAPACAWNVPPKSMMLLAELSGSSGSNDGLYIVSVTGAGSASLFNLNGTTPTLGTESGLTLNFYSIRYSIGASFDGFSLAYNDLSTKAVGSIETYGDVGNSTDGICKVTYVTTSEAKYVWVIQKTVAGSASTNVFSISSIGEVYSNLGSTAGVPIKGSSDSLWSTSVYGIQNAAGIGVYGYCTTGAGNGVRGKCNHASGYGVYGLNNLGTAIYGEAESNSGIGVYGKCTSGSGTGVMGECNDASGYGIIGVNDSGYAIYGEGSGGLAGVYGKCTSGSEGKGVIGECGVADGYGVYGVGTGTGVYGLTESGVGVHGKSEGGIAVKAETTTSSSKGIKVEVPGGTSYGAYIEANGSGSIGVYSEAEGTDGVGVIGKATSGIAGVQGSEFAYTTEQWCTVEIPLTQGVPIYPVGWDFDGYYWQSSDTGSILIFIWNDFPSNSKFEFITVAYDNDGTKFSARVYRKRSTISGRPFAPYIVTSTESCFTSGSPPSDLSIEFTGTSGSKDANFIPNGVDSFSRYNSSLADETTDTLKIVVYSSKSGQKIGGIYCSFSYYSVSPYGASFHANVTP